MSNYIEIQVPNVSPEMAEVLIARFSAIGFEGFEEGEHVLSAFVKEQDFDRDTVAQILSSYRLEYATQLVTERNWNEEWEKHFEPVLVDDFLAIRALFHPPLARVRHEIIITPKMSFGTGHHATTYMMIQQMRDIDFSNKKVLDFGTGTGILAILAEMLGASEVIAVDNDEWSIRNAGENMEMNDSGKIRLSLADVPPISEAFDVILANINRNVILRFLPELSRMLHADGILVISGLLKEDEPFVLESAIKEGLKHAQTLQRDKWISLTLNP